jgi:hypothetical protein
VPSFKNFFLLVSRTQDQNVSEELVFSSSEHRCTSSVPGKEYVPRSQPHTGQYCSLNRAEPHLAPPIQLFATVESLQLLSRQSGELLGTDSARNPCECWGMMKKRNNSIKRARTTIASVNKEMQKPRLTESVRNEGRDQLVPVAEQPPARPARV